MRQIGKIFADSNQRHHGETVGGKVVVLLLSRQTLLGLGQKNGLAIIAPPAHNTNLASSLCHPS